MTVYNFNFGNTAVGVDDTRIQTEQFLFGNILRLTLDDEMIVADALKFLIERVVCVVIIAVPVLVDGNGTLEILLTGRIVVGNIHTLIDRDIFPGHGIHCRQCVAVCICSDSGSVIVFGFVLQNPERYSFGRIHCFGKRQGTDRIQCDFTVLRYRFSDGHTAIADRISTSRQVIDLDSRDKLALAVGRGGAGRYGDSTIVGLIFQGSIDRLDFLTVRILGNNDIRRRVGNRFSGVIFICGVPHQPEGYCFGRIRGQSNRYCQVAFCC